MSTLPALPGAVELTANMSPLSLTSKRWPNLCPDPPSAESIVAHWVHESYVDPSAPIPHSYMYTLPVSELSPGADTNMYFVGVLLTELAPGSAILCAQPKFCDA